MLVPGYAEPVKRRGAAQALADMLGYDVDLLDLHGASTVMQAQVLTTGATLWSKQPEPLRGLRLEEARTPRHAFVPL